MCVQYKELYQVLENYDFKQTPPIYKYTAYGKREKTICQNGNGSGLFIIERTQKNNFFEKEEFGQWTKGLCHCINQQNY